MERMMFKCALFPILLILLAAVASADLKITTKQSAMGHSYESTVLIKGSRQRSDSPGGLVSLLQCDLNRTIMLNDRSKSYMITQFEGDTSADETKPAQRAPSQTQQPTTTRKGGVVTFTSTMVDTGERKKMFGYTARHIKTSMTKEASPDACDPKPMKIETDGWYIDFEYKLDCLTSHPHVPTGPGSPSKPDCQDQIKFRRAGGGRLGYPLDVTTTIYQEDGKTFSTSTQVTDLSTATLDDSLFDIPAGYHEAKNYSELMGMPSVTDMVNHARAGQTPREGMGEAGGSKPAGGVRVGIVGFNNKSGQDVSSDSLRSRLIGEIAGSNIDAVPIDAASSSAIVSEAKQKQCDYILYTNIDEVKKPSTASKIGGILGRRTAGVGGGDKYEAQIDYILYPTGSNSPVLSSGGSGKGSGAAEAALSDALGHEARDVVNQVKKH